MEYRQLGKNGPTVSVVGFGCWAIGGHGYGEVDDATSVAAVHRALELGVTLFDTADVYGFGRSERVLSEALGSRRNDAVIATKFGVAWDDTGKTRKDISPARVVRALDDSLSRLGVERISLYQVHWPDGITPLEDTLAELVRQRDAGKIQFIGVTNFEAAAIEAADRDRVITSAQYSFNLLDRARARDISRCADLGVGVLAYGVLGRGLFSGKFQERAEFAAGDTRAVDPAFSTDAIEKSRCVTSTLGDIAVRRSGTPGQAAISWALGVRGVTSAIVGVKSPRQAEENAGAAAVTLTSTDCAALDLATGLGAE